jgi:hypothetical protein
MFWLGRSLGLTRLLVVAGLVTGAVFAGTARADSSDLSISSPYSISEGSWNQLVGSVPFGTSSESWSYAKGSDASAAGSCAFSSSSSLSPSFDCSDDGTYAVTLTADGQSTSAPISVVNVAPWAAIRAPSSGYITSRYFPVNVSVAFSDPGTTDTHTCAITWGDGKVTWGYVLESGGAGTCRASHTYYVGGWWTVSATVYDDDGGAGVTQSISVRTI